MTTGEFYMTTEAQFRQSGRTSVLIRAAQAIDGLFIVHSEEMKRLMLRKYPDANVESMNTTKLFGNRKPVILDHLVVHALLDENRREMIQLRSKIQEQNFMIKNLEERIEDMYDG